MRSQCHECIDPHTRIIINGYYNFSWICSRIKQPSSFFKLQQLWWDAEVCPPGSYQIVAVENWKIFLGGSWLCHMDIESFSRTKSIWRGFQTGWSSGIGKHSVPWLAVAACLRSSYSGGNFPIWKDRVPPQSELSLRNLAWLVMVSPSWSAVSGEVKSQKAEEKRNRDGWCC